MNAPFVRYGRHRLPFLNIFLFSFLLQPGYGQNPARFQKEIDQFKSDTTDYSLKQNLILFTGSSTIRMWTDLQQDFPKLAVLNRGFGGSCMSDLLYYADTVILKYKPPMIFIYEGDNDIAIGITPRDIIETARKLLDRIRQELPESTICFISAKPSLARWSRKGDYQGFNQQLKDFTLSCKNVYFLNMWSSMLDSDGNPKKDIFLDDGLHMNRAGYDIWRKSVEEFLDARR